MAEHVIRLPDVGEGVAEAELVEWHVKIGDLVREDAALAAVMTDKATVEIPSPVEGEIVWLGAKIGDVVAVGSDLVRLKVPGDGNSSATGEQALPQANAPAAKGTESALMAKPRIGDSRERATAESALPVSATSEPARTAPRRQFAHGAPRPEGEKPLAAPGGSPAGHERPESTCVKFPAPARPAASRTRIWTHSSRRRAGTARTPAFRRGLPSKTSR